MVLPFATDSPALYRMPIITTIMWELTVVPAELSIQFSLTWSILTAANGSENLSGKYSMTFTGMVALIRTLSESRWTRSFHDFFGFPTASSMKGIYEALWASAQVVVKG
jgi:hypothetical protein